MKKFLQSSLGTLTIWAVVFTMTGILANWFMGAEYLFIIICIATFLFILVGIFVGIRNTVNDASKGADQNKPE